MPFGPTDYDDKRRVREVSSGARWRRMSKAEIDEWWAVVGIGEGPDYTPIRMTTLQCSFMLRLMKWCEIPHQVFHAFAIAARQGPVGVDAGWFEQWEAYKARGYRLRFEEVDADSDADSEADDD